MNSPFIPQDKRNKLEEELKKKEQYLSKMIMGEKEKIESSKKKEPAIVEIKESEEEKKDKDKE